MEVLGRNLSNGVVTFLVGHAIEELREQCAVEFAAQNFTNLDLLHHLTAGVKSFATEFSYVGMDEMRQACGGAGFLLSSGIAA